MRSNGAFKLGVISNGEGWMNMFKDRNRTSHSYNETTAREIINNIFDSYFNLFAALQIEMEKLLDANESNLF